MEQWLPLFEILLNVASLEGEASFWLLEENRHLPHSHSSSTASLPTTSAFLSLLLSPIPSLPSLSTCSTSPNAPIWLQSLPFATQTRILSLLATEHHRFCPLLLRSIVSHVLNSDLPSSSDHPAFWVRRAASHLFDVSPSLVTEAEQWGEDDFDSLPDWLEDAAKTSTRILPWLPINLRQLQEAATFELSKNFKSDDMASRSKITKYPSNLEPIYITPPLLHSGVREQAVVLKAELLASDSTADSLRVARQLRQICLESGAGNELDVMTMIEPWEANDETLSVLLLHLANDDDFLSKSWPSYVACSIALPKLVTLKSPVSRALLSATVYFCKQYQVAAVEALIHPLILRKEGVNSVLCDVLVRIIKECLHPFHVSAFCQRLLCEGGKDARPICLPCHRDLISEQVVWTESLFNLFQHILNQEVFLTPDTSDKLVSIIVEKATEFSSSLKFGNFLLCFVTKCSYAVDAHKVLVRDASKKTNTLVTRSILARLNA